MLIVVGNNLLPQNGPLFRIRTARSTEWENLVERESLRERWTFSSCGVKKNISEFMIQIMLNRDGWHVLMFNILFEYNIIHEISIKWRISTLHNVFRNKATWERNYWETPEAISKCNNEDQSNALRLRGRALRTWEAYSYKKLKYHVNYFRSFTQKIIFLFFSLAARSRRQGAVWRSGYAVCRFTRESHGQWARCATSRGQQTTEDPRVRGNWSPRKRYAIVLFSDVILTLKFVWQNT